MVDRKVQGVRHYKAGYEVRSEVIPAGESGSDQPMIMKSAYTPDGHYIGNSKMAHLLCAKRGIKPEPREPDCTNANGDCGQDCSIGLCANEQKWYGWSHRAIHGFGVGDEIEAGDCCSSSGWTEEYLVAHPEEDYSLPVGFRAETLGDCRRMAVAFAESVS